MNSIQRRAAQRKRHRHNVRQVIKPAVKAQCAKRGINYAGFEIRDGGRTIAVFDKAGDEYVSSVT